MAKRIEPTGEATAAAIQVAWHLVEQRTASSEGRKPTDLARQVAARRSAGPLGFARLRSRSMCASPLPSAIRS